METLGISDGVYPTCKICDRGTLMPRKMRRLSGPAVAIGYILLIPSILGMVACAILLIIAILAGVAGAAHGSALVSGFAGIGSLAILYVAVLCFVGGLVGWLLVMKKHVLQCNHCGAVINAAAPAASQVDGNTVSASRVVFVVSLLVFLLIGTIWASKYKGRFWASNDGADTSTSTPTTPTATTAEPAQSTPDNSDSAPAQPETWKLFTSADGHFSVLFPATAQQLKEPPESHVHGFASSADKGQSVYVVEYTDLRPGIGPEAVPQAILGAEEKIEIGKGLLVKDKIIDLHGVPGRAFETVDASGDSAFMREFFTWPRLYTVMVLVRKGYTATHAARFFNSFRILDNPQVTTAGGQAQPAAEDSTADSPQPAGTLVRVFPTCQFGAIYGELCKPVWKRIEADNGEVTWIDMHLLRDVPPLHYVWVYTSVPNTAQNPYDMKMLMFDCQGHFQSTGGPVMDAPPRSVAGEIASAVCGNQGSSGGRPCVNEISGQRVTKVCGTPGEPPYCIGYSPAACKRIEHGVHSRVRPSYCNIPWPDQESAGLTEEQVRICSVRASQGIDPVP